jgi:hypothetical protein
MKNRMWEGEQDGGWRLRGRLDLMRGNRMEVQLRMLEPAGEIDEGEGAG